MRGEQAGAEALGLRASQLVHTAAHALCQRLDLVCDDGEAVAGQTGMQLLADGGLPSRDVHELQNASKDCAAGNVSKRDCAQLVTERHRALL